jgi:hypothetical protein
MKVSQIVKSRGDLAYADGASTNGSSSMSCWKEAGCSRALECPNRSETIYVSVGRQAVGMGASSSIELLRARLLPEPALMDP